MYLLKDTEIRLRNHSLWHDIRFSPFCQVYEPLNDKVYDIYIYILLGEYIKIIYVSKS